MRSIVKTRSRAACGLRTRRLRTHRRRVCHSLCAALCALLCISGVCAIAEANGSAHHPTLSVADVRQQTESGWHETYEAHGRTITVDVPIATPDVTAFPILRVDFVPKLSEEAAAPFKVGMEYLLWDSVWTHKDGGGFNGSFQNDDGELWYAPVCEPPDNATDFTMTPLPLAAADLDTAYLDGSELTLRQADTFYQGWIAKLYPNQLFDMRIIKIELQSAITHKKRVIVPQGTYWLTYQQVLGGVPVLSRINEAFNGTVGHTPALEEYLQNGGGNGDCTVSERDDFSVRYRLYQTESVLHEDVPLCSFDAIRKQLESFIADGTLRKVRSVKLGYVSYPNPDNPQTFVLLPMWVVHVRLMDKSTSEIPPSMLKDPVTADEYSTYHLFFNAQTGEMVDRLRTDDKRCAMPKIIAW